MRPSPLLLAFFLYGSLAAPLCHAQAAKPASVPPNLEKLEEGSAPDITIRKPETNTRTVEKREQGVVTDVQVQSGKSNYHVKQGAGAGNAAPGDAQSNTIRAPQWQIKEFDWGRKKKAVQTDEQSAPVDAPPPPPLQKK